MQASNPAAMKLLFLGLAGAAGALARYGLGGLVQRLGSGTFPWGTMVVNLTGCFLFGLIWAISEDRIAISGQVRIILLVGFMGAFTTFSTFAFETTQMLRDAEWLRAGFNAATQNVVGIVVLFVGLKMGRLF